MIEPLPHDAKEPDIVAKLNELIGAHNERNSTELSPEQLAMMPPGMAHRFLRNQELVRLRELEKTKE